MTTAAPAPEVPPKTTPTVSDVVQQRLERRFAGQKFEARMEGACVVIAVKNAADSPLLQRFQPLALERAADMAADEIALSFSSEEPCLNWFGDPEILSHDPADCDFTRLAQVGAILRDHDSSKIVGVPTRVWLDAQQRKGRLQMRWGSTQIAKDNRQEAEVDKTLRGVSVGYLVDQWVWLADETVSYQNRIKGPCWVATKWQAIESSLTPIPADSSVGLNRTATPAGRPHTEDSGMKTKEELAAEAARTAAPVEVKPVVVEVKTAPTAEEAVKAERTRAADILKRCKAHGCEELATKLIDEGLTPEAAAQRILDELARKNPAVDVQVVKDGRASFQRAALSGLMLRMGRIDHEAARKDGGTDFAGRTLVDVARECLNRAGMSLKGSVNDIVDRALRGPKINSGEIEEFSRAAGEVITVGVSDFPLLLAAGANKSLIDSYRNAPVTWPKWCKRGSLSDFKSTGRIKISESGGLELIAENGPYPAGKMSEKKENIQLATYGKKFGISRQAIINDDLDGFGSQAVKHGRAAARKPNNLAVKVLVANAALSDAVALFAAGHNNYNAAAANSLDTVAHAITGIGNLCTMLMTQKAMLHADEAAKESLYLGLMPKVLLVPVSGGQYFNAKTVIASATMPSATASGVVNAIQGIAEVVPEPSLEDTLLTGSSTTAFYLFADPADAPVVEVAFLQGNDQPYMEEIDQTDSDGRIWKVRLDVAAAVIDFAGACKEKGAA